MLSSKCFFRSVGPKPKNENENTKYYGTFIPFKSWLYSKMGNPFFCFGHGVCIISSCLGKIKSFFNNSKQAIFVDVQRLHENGKWIVCISNKVYTFLLLYENVSFTADLGHLSFSMVQLFLSRLARIRSR